MAKPPRMTSKMPKPAPKNAVLKGAPAKVVRPVLTGPRLKATPAAAIDRANRAQAMEAREARAMGVGAKPAGKLKATPDEAAAIDRANRAQAREASFIRTTVRERTTPQKKK